MRHIPARLLAAVALLALLAGGPAAADSGDYYRSSDGKMVHRPSRAKVPGQRVTAICRDGSFSYSHHHQGTCSHHGGVATWQAPG